MTTDDLAEARAELAPTLLSASRRLRERCSNFEDTAKEPHPAIARGFEASAKLAAIAKTYESKASEAPVTFDARKLEAKFPEWIPEHLLRTSSELPARPFASTASQRAYFVEVHSLVDGVHDSIARNILRDGKQKVADLRAMRERATEILHDAARSLDSPASFICSDEQYGALVEHVRDAAEMIHENEESAPVLREHIAKSLFAVLKVRTIDHARTAAAVRDRGLSVPPYRRPTD